MKALYTIIFSILFFASCSKDQTPEPIIEEPAVDVCDSISKAFASNVMPIFQDNCVSCHSGSFPSGGIKLADHNDISTNLTVVLKTINHESGVTPMPYQLPKLSDSLIQVIECWAADGAPNN